MATKKELQDHFEAMPDLKQVWVNDEGDWIHFGHPAYTKVVTREEALNENTDEPKKSKKSKPETE